MCASVLIVDDDPAFRQIARAMLARAGLLVTGEAGTAAAAVGAAHALRPDVLLVDVGLPDADGVSLAEELAALPWSPQVVLTSTDPDATDAEEVERSGASGFVPKSELPGRGVELMLGGF